MNFELYKNKGLSGCKLHLIDSVLVRKSSPNLNYNKRLESQMNKQKSFNIPSLSEVKTPIVYNSGYINDLFYFDMEYINGQQPLDIFISGTKMEIKNISNNIENYFDCLFYSLSPSVQIEIEIDHFKLSNRKKLISLYEKSNYGNFITYLINIIDNIECVNFRISNCHGDFTIANMIYCDNSLYLLDFLDSYIESPIIDLVKLKQDLYHNWLLLNSNYSNQESFRAIQTSLYLWEIISHKYSEYIDTLEFRIIEAINFLRIEPYIDHKKKILLDKIIKSLDIYEEFNNTNGGQIVKISKY